MGAEHDLTRSFPAEASHGDQGRTCFAVLSVTCRIEQMWRELQEKREKIWEMQVWCRLWFFHRLLEDWPCTYSWGEVVCCKHCLGKIEPYPCITEVHLVCNWWKLILTWKISQALPVRMIALELGTESPKWIQILASVNSPNVGHLKLFHLETMQWCLLFFREKCWDKIIIIFF